MLLTKRERKHLLREARARAKLPEVRDRSTIPAVMGNHLILRVDFSSLRMSNLTKLASINLCKGSSRSF